jgi:hypothetical protein
MPAKRHRARFAGLLRRIPTELVEFLSTRLELLPVIAIIDPFA